MIPSAINTVVVVPLTGNVDRARAPGNVLLRPSETGLPKESVANVSQVLALDRSMLVEHVGRLPDGRLSAVLAGIDVVLGR